MLDRVRQKALAAAKSRRASQEELKEAPQRVKEIERELLQMQLQPETKHGEERAQRYSRLLRLRNMRQRFTERRPLDTSDQPNGIILAVVMTVASFMICAFCAVGSYVGVQYLHQKPDPIAAASAFWVNVESRSYGEVRSSYLSPTLRVQYDQNSFQQLAQQADTDYGPVSNAVLFKQAGDMTQTAILTYQVTRNKTYNATLTLVLHGGVWGVDDLGAVFDPSQAGLPAPTPSPSPTGPPTPTDVPTVTPVPTATTGG